MNRRLALWTLVAATTLLARNARAQQGEVTIGYQGLPYKATGESATGIQVSEGVLLHVGAGAEAGYDTNVFYQETNPAGSGIIRTSLFAELLNATRGGTVGRLAFNARAGVTYRRYQSDNPDISLKGYDNAWMPTAGVALSTSSGQFGFGIADSFVRVEDPPYTPGQNAIVRDNNQASAELRWAPGGGRITSMLRYTNMLDVFENPELKHATSDYNYMMLDVSWKWLPKTAVFLSAQQGFVFYTENQPAVGAKVSSYPLQLTTGLRGLLTEKTSALLQVGYMNGFYSSGGSTGGFWGSTFAQLALTVRPTMLSRVVGGYRHDFTNAVVSSFSYNDTAFLSYVQEIAGRVALDLSGRYQHRRYEGVLLDPSQAGRIDDFFQVGATLDYFVRNWIYAGVGYALLSNNSNLPNLDYVKQQMFVRLGVTY
jgi:hypothetical protein